MAHWKRGYLLVQFAPHIHRVFVCLQETAELDIFCLDLESWTWTQL